MRFDVVTLFPGQFAALTQEGVVARALQRGLARLHLHNPRDYASDLHRTVDDRPYGGGPGMVMQYAPVRAAIESARAGAMAEGIDARVAYLSPQGQLLRQAKAQEIAAAPGWVLLAGRYEGVDERLVEDCVDEEWSIGDYVLSGGELAAMVVMDAAIRLLPGALGHADSARYDSHTSGLLDCPHYTRPESLGSDDDDAGASHFAHSRLGSGSATRQPVGDLGGPSPRRPARPDATPARAARNVPPVLLSGDHQAIARWRLKQALGRTWERRPDLLSERGMNDVEEQLLDEYRQEASRD